MFLTLIGIEQLKYCKILNNEDSILRKFSLIFNHHFGEIFKRKKKLISREIAHIFYLFSFSP